MTAFELGRIAMLAGIVAALVAACGARSSVLGVSWTGVVQGTGGTTTTGTGAGGGTTTTGTGAGGGSTSTGTGGQGGGSAGPCTTLAWVGEPLFVGSDMGSVSRPRLIRVSDTDVALVFEAQALSQLYSRAIQPWGAWLPVPGVLGFQGTGGRFDVAPGPPGTFAFATAAPSVEKMWIGQSPPGNEGTWETVVSLPGELKLVAGAPSGSFLVGHGPITGVSLARLPSLNDTAADSLGSLGCASPQAIADGVAIGDDAFLVASTNQAPFDDCADPGPLGPPVVVQLVKVTAVGWEPGGYVTESGPVLDLQIAPRVGGAWLAYRVDGDPQLHVLRIDLDGQIIDALLTAGATTNGDAVTSFRDGFAHVTTSPGDANAAGVVKLDLHASAGVDSITYSSPMLSTYGRPAVVSSDDGRSLLVAFHHSDSGPGTIGLLRADCVP